MRPKDDWTLGAMPETNSACKASWMHLTQTQNLARWIPRVLFKVAD